MITTYEQYSRLRDIRMIAEAGKLKINVILSKWGCGKFYSITAFMADNPTQPLPYMCYGDISADAVKRLIETGHNIKL